ncbi:MAG: type II toxin-antitoxin system VapC family toxin [Vicinamibacterales bacterium]
MKLRYLLDTSIVSVPISKTPDEAILRRIDARSPECAIAAPVWHELTYGCRRLPPGKRRTALEAYLRDVVRVSFPNLPYDEAAATWHGEERARLEGKGQPGPFVDGQIASIAHVHGLVLVTANDKDFVRFEGLKVENWSKGHTRRKRSPRHDVRRI